MQQLFQMLTCKFSPQFHVPICHWGQFRPILVLEQFHIVEDALVSADDGIGPFDKQLIGPGGEISDRTCAMMVVPPPPAAVCRPLRAFLRPWSAQAKEFELQFAS